MSEQYYRWLMEKASSEGLSPDYAGMDQGIVGTALRHLQAEKLLGDKIKGSVLLDLGCGTGLLVESLARAKIQPKTHLGVDFLQEREVAFNNRLEMHHQPGHFIVSPINDLKWERMGEVAVALGVIGPMPFHSLASVEHLIHRMRDWAPKGGMVTIPIMREGFLGCPEQAHFAIEDVEQLCKMSLLRGIRLTVHSQKEAALWW